MNIIKLGFMSKGCKNTLISQMEASFVLVGANKMEVGWLITVLYGTLHFTA